MNNMPMYRQVLFIFMMCFGLMSTACSSENVMTVTASAYNSLPGQGVGDVTRGAWGDPLVPGMQVIAVSRDLLEQGLTYNAVVRIDGLPGTWTVKDTMHRRWQNKIDIYMGTDRSAALEWGVRKVTIRY